jgi:pimeloyl-ACP methyl ester carboxylesterase
MIFDGFFPRAAASRPAETPTLLFLHGAACGAWVWQQGFAGTCEEAGFPGEAVQFERVVERHPAGLGDYVTQVRAAMARIGGPVVLVGHSLGALVAQRLLLEPQVKGAALLAPVPPEGLWLSSTRLALTDPSLWTESARMDAPVGQADPSLAATLFSTAMPAAEAQQWLARMGGESSNALLEAQGPQPVPHGWVHGRPVLVLGAAEDRLISHDAVQRCAMWHSATPRFLPSMGHLMMLEPGWPDVAQLLLGWLRGL